MWHFWLHYSDEERGQCISLPMLLNLTLGLDAYSIFLLWLSVQNIRVMMPQFSLSQVSVESSITVDYWTKIRCLRSCCKINLFWISANSKYPPPPPRCGSLPVSPRVCMRVCVCHTFGYSSLSKHNTKQLKLHHLALTLRKRSQGCTASAPVDSGTQLPIPAPFSCFGCLTGSDRQLDWNK